MSHPTREQRAELCEQRVTLDGKPARISGYDLPFAIVRDRASGLSAEWAWETVARIVSRGGMFQS